MNGSSAVTYLAVIGGVFLLIALSFVASPLLAIAVFVLATPILLLMAAASRRRSAAADARSRRGPRWQTGSSEALPPRPINRRPSGEPVSGEG
jgi:hypothetical protein